jgi:hypothetical protein
MSSIFEDPRDADRGGNRNVVDLDGSSAERDESAAGDFRAIEVPASPMAFRRGRVVELDGSKESPNG